MATQVVMSKLSPTMEEGQLAKWLKKEGDTVSPGEPLAEVETDKAAMEMQAFASGVLRKILIKEGETVPLGQVVAIIAEPDEDISALLAEAESGQITQDNQKSIKESVAAGGYGAQQELATIIVDDERTQATIQGKPLTGDVGGAPSTAEQQNGTAIKTKPEPHQGAGEQVGNGSGPSTTDTASPDSDRNLGASGATGNGGQQTTGRLIISPLAARMAAEAGLNLQTLVGTGPSGRIVKRDIEAALSANAAQPQPISAEAPTEQQQVPATQLRAVEAPPPPQSTAQQPATLPAVEGASAYRDVPITEMRRVIARRLTSSVGPVPHFFLTSEIEMDQAVELRRSINDLDAELKISINDLIIRVAAVALTEHPQVNASFQDKSIRYYDQADIGVAVAIEDGLITPIVRAADRKRLGEISREVREMAARARSRKLRPEEYTGATFSISNLGMFGIDEFTAIINPPEAAILAVGAMQQKPVVRDGAVTVRQIMRVTMSCDHRVVDGASGAQFLQTFKKMLENPLRLMV